MGNGKYYYTSNKLLLETASFWQVWDGGGMSVDSALPSCEALFGGSQTSKDRSMHKKKIK